MFKKSMCGALLTVLCCLPVVSNAATCRAGQAAVEGSKAGYEQAKRAADVWAQKERTMSDQLQQCLSRIRQTSITLPSFPSLSDIFNQMVEKICQAAIDEINSHIPSSIDPWEEFKGAVR